MQGFIAGAALCSHASSSVFKRLFAGAGLALVAGSALAQPPAVVAPSNFAEIEARGPLPQRYPAGSIKSEDSAQKALQEAAEERSALQTRYVIEQRACYKKFLVNECLEQAKDKKRLADKGVKQVEIEANTWRRQAQVDERDRSLADQHARDQQDAARRLEDQKKQQAAAVRKQQDSKSKNAQVQQRIDQNQGVAPDARIRAHDAQVRQQQAEEAARAPERAANAAKREQRIKDAEQHKQDVARKKADNERERAEKKRLQEKQQLKEQQQKDQQQKDQQQKDQQQKDQQQQQ